MNRSRFFRIRYLLLIVFCFALFFSIARPFGLSAPSLQIGECDAIFHEGGVSYEVSCRLSNNGVLPVYVAKGDGKDFSSSGKIRYTDGTIQENQTRIKNWNTSIFWGKEVMFHFFDAIPVADDVPKPVEVGVPLRDIWGNSKTVWVSVELKE